MRTTFAQYRDLLVTYLQPQWPKVVLLALLLGSDIALQLLNPQILRYFIDTTQAKGPLDVLVRAALLFLVVVFVAQIVASLAAYVGEDVGWIATNTLRADLTLHCLRLDMSFHKTRTAGEMIERIDGDVGVLANFFSQCMLLVLGNLLFLIGVLLLVFHEDWRIGLALALYTLLSLTVLQRVQGVAVPYFKAYRQVVAELSGFWEERLTGREDIRANGAEPFVMLRHQQLLRHVMRKGRASTLMGRVFQSLLEFLSSVGLATAFALSAYLLHIGLVSLGTVYLIFYYTNQLATNLGTITEQINDLQGATASIERIRELYYTVSRLSDAGTVPVPATPPSVAFEQVSFSYVEGTPVLQDVSFRLEAGRVLGVLGHTGSGKTTLSRLLFRFYDSSEGHISLDDGDIRAMPLQALRQRIGVVTQEVQLFHATVRDNLTLFDEHITDARLLEVLHELELMAWYHSLPQGLDTQLSAGGGNLSAGEAQLLALTRVFLKNPSLVILDEASSRLDPATERLLEGTIARLLFKRTAIVIAHRLATVQQADEILILEQGRVREYGLREQLAQASTSRYAHLLQTGLEETLA